MLFKERKTTFEIRETKNLVSKKSSYYFKEGVKWIRVSKENYHTALDLNKADFPTMLKKSEGFHRYDKVISY